MSQRESVSAYVYYMSSYVLILNKLTRVMNLCEFPLRQV